ncbi:MAG: hypothetical protein AAGC55_21830, partial [Myxococcota bacterium]
MATNTYQSICLKNEGDDGIQRTKPSYNFDYTFHQLEYDSTVKSRKNSDTTAEGSGAFWGVHIDLKDEFKTETINNQTFHRHNILVVFHLHSYYSSVDESKVELSEFARRLAERQDAPGFFDACGLYYVR